MKDIYSQLKKNDLERLIPIKDEENRKRHIIYDESALNSKQIKNQLFSFSLNDFK